VRTRASGGDDYGAESDGSDAGRVSEIRDFGGCFGRYEFGRWLCGDRVGKKRSNDEKRSGVGWPNIDVGYGLSEWSRLQGDSTMDQRKFAMAISTLALVAGIVWIFGIGERKVQANAKPQNTACVQDCKSKLDSCLSAIGPNSSNRDGLRQACQDSYDSCVKRCSPQNQAQQELATEDRY
jgi:hypothetical protein